jgi:hypothetical protein
MDIKESHEEERKGGRGSRPVPGLRPLYKHSPAAVWNGGRTTTISQPPVQAAVDRLPPLTLAVGGYQAGHAGSFQLQFEVAVGWHLPLFPAVVGPNRRSKPRLVAISAAVESNFILVKSKEKIYKNFSFGLLR